MPIKRTTKGGRPAFKFGDAGTAYPYEPGNKQSREKARRRAMRQGQAIQAKKSRPRG